MSMRDDLFGSPEPQGSFDGADLFDFDEPETPRDNGNEIDHDDLLNGLINFIPPQDYPSGPGGSQPIVTSQPEPPTFDNDGFDLGIDLGDLPPIQDPMLPTEVADDIDAWRYADNPADATPAYDRLLRVTATQFVERMNANMYSEDGEFMLNTLLDARTTKTAFDLCATLLYMANMYDNPLYRHETWPVQASVWTRFWITHSPKHMRDAQGRYSAGEYASTFYQDKLRDAVFAHEDYAKYDEAFGGRAPPSEFWDVAVYAANALFNTNGNGNGVVRATPKVLRLLDAILNPEAAVWQSYDTKMSALAMPAILAPNEVWHREWLMQVRSAYIRAAAVHTTDADTNLVAFHPGFKHRNMNELLHQSRQTFLDIRTAATIVPDDASPDDRVRIQAEAYQQAERDADAIVDELADPTHMQFPFHGVYATNLGPTFLTAYAHLSTNLPNARHERYERAEATSLGMSYANYPTWSKAFRRCIPSWIGVVTFVLPLASQHGQTKLDPVHYAEGYGLQMYLTRMWSTMEADIDIDWLARGEEAFFTPDGAFDDWLAKWWNSILINGHPSEFWGDHFRNRFQDAATRIRMSPNTDEALNEWQRTLADDITSGRFYDVTAPFLPLLGLRATRIWELFGYDGNGNKMFADYRAILVQRTENMLETYPAPDKGLSIDAHVLQYAKDVEIVILKGELGEPIPDAPAMLKWKDDSTSPSKDSILFRFARDTISKPLYGDQGEYPMPQLVLDIPETTDATDAQVDTVAERPLEHNDAVMAELLVDAHDMVGGDTTEIDTGYVGGDDGGDIDMGEPEDPEEPEEPEEPVPTPAGQERPGRGKGKGRGRGRRTARVRTASPSSAGVARRKQARRDDDQRQTRTDARVWHDTNIPRPETHSKSNIVYENAFPLDRIYAGAKNAATRKRKNAGYDPYPVQFYTVAQLRSIRMKQSSHMRAWRTLQLIARASPYARVDEFRVTADRSWWSIVDHVFMRYSPMIADETKLAAMNESIDPNAFHRSVYSYAYNAFYHARQNTPDMPHPMLRYIFNFPGEFADPDNVGAETIGALRAEFAALLQAQPGAMPEIIIDELRELCKCLYASLIAKKGQNIVEDCPDFDTNPTPVKLFLMRLLLVINNSVMRPSRALEYWIRDASDDATFRARASFIGWDTPLGTVLNRRDPDDETLRSDGSLITFLPDYDWTPEYMYPENKTRELLDKNKGPVSRAAKQAFANGEQVELRHPYMNELLDDDQIAAVFNDDDIRAKQDLGERISATGALEEYENKKTIKLPFTRQRIDNAVSAHEQLNNAALEPVAINAVLGFRIRRRNFGIVSALASWNREDQMWYLNGTMRLSLPTTSNNKNQTLFLKPLNMLQFTFATQDASDDAPAVSRGIALMGSIPGDLANHFNATFTGTDNATHTLTYDKYGVALDGDVIPEDMLPARRGGFHTFLPYGFTQTREYARLFGSNVDAASKDYSAVQNYDLRSQGPMDASAVVGRLEDMARQQRAAVQPQYLDTSRATAAEPGRVVDVPRPQLQFQGNGSPQYTHPTGVQSAFMMPALVEDHIRKRVETVFGAGFGSGRILATQQPLVNSDDPVSVTPDRAMGPQAGRALMRMCADVHVHRFTIFDNTLLTLQQRYALGLRVRAWREIDGAAPQDPRSTAYLLAAAFERDVVAVEAATQDIDPVQWRDEKRTWLDRILDGM